MRDFFYCFLFILKNCLKCGQFNQRFWWINIFNVLRKNASFPSVEFPIRFAFCTNIFAWKIDQEKTCWMGKIRKLTVIKFSNYWMLCALKYAMRSGAEWLLCASNECLLLLHFNCLKTWIISRWFVSMAKEKETPRNILESDSFHHK